MKVLLVVIAAGGATGFWFWLAQSQPLAALVGNCVMWVTVAVWANLTTSRFP